MTKDEIFDAVIMEIDRIFGKKTGFGGEASEYAWLLQHYGVTEEEDVTWQRICEVNSLEEDDVEPLDPVDEGDAKVIAFLNDEPAVLTFLDALLLKYRSSAAVYPR